MNNSDSGEDLDDPVKVHLLCTQNKRQDEFIVCLIDGLKWAKVD